MSKQADCLVESSESLNEKEILWGNQHDGTERHQMGNTLMIAQTDIAYVLDESSYMTED
jgi:hypothetical protein